LTFYYLLFTFQAIVKKRPLTDTLLVV